MVMNSEKTMKENRNLLIITTLLCLLPAFLGILLWNRLPEEIPVHWNFEGIADRTAGKATAVFLTPLFLAGVHHLCAFVTRNDPKHDTIPGRIKALVLWIMPLLSIFVSLLTYIAAFNAAVDVNMAVSIFLGLLLISVGLYLPECPHNYTIGIKLPWTLADEGNWKKTHAFAGPLWVCGGFVMILTSFLRIQNNTILFLVVLVIAIVPGIYYWRLYKTTAGADKSE